MPRPLIVAHRGASSRCPENTLRAMDAAFHTEPPADGLECDIRLTADGVPVVFHDDETTRLTGEGGSIEARTAHEVRALRVREEPIPTLAELLERLPGYGVGGLLANIEIKATPRADALVAACRPLLDPLTRPGSGVRLVVSSFDPRVLRAAQAASAPWRLAFLYEEEAALELLRFFDPATPLDLHPDHRLVDADHLARHAARPEYGPTHRAFRVWTVDEPARAWQLGALGVEAVITNRPNWLLRQAEAPLAASSAEPSDT